MNSIESVTQQIKTLIEYLDKDLLIPLDPNLNQIPKVQKEACKNKLEKMYTILRTKNLPSKQHRNMGLSRIITDSWPFGSKLGEDIIKAEKSYIDL